jgi:hypothetical protein
MADQRTRIKAEALAILTAPGGPCDPFSGSVKNPDMMARIIEQSLDIFVSQNPQLSGQSADELADAFLHFMEERQKLPSSKRIGAEEDFGVEDDFDADDD